jgi:plastocyanin
VLPLAAAAACGSSTPTGANTPPASTPTTAAASDIEIVPGAETMTTGAFTPNPKSVSLGQSGSATVRWVNQDVVSGGAYGGSTGTTHNITSDNGAFAASGLLAAGASFTATFSAPGTFPFHCAIHPNMVGSIVVTK